MAPYNATKEDAGAELEVKTNVLDFSNSLDVNGCSLGDIRPLTEEIDLHRKRAILIARSLYLYDKRPLYKESQMNRA